jgi:predicted membrane protein
MVSTTWGQDFQKAYTLASGSGISISNVSGDISVIGYDGGAVLVTAFKEGRNKDVVEIVDESTTGKLVLKVRYPQGGNYDASVRFEVQVPRGTAFQYDSLSTASGDIRLAEATGEVRAKTASGDVTVHQVQGNVQVSTASGDIEITQVRGAVQASTASGDVRIDDVEGTATASSASGDLDVGLTRVEGAGEMRFSSASGDVTVRVPPQVNADVEMSTANGSLKTDFPLTIEDREHSGQKAYGKLGTGAIKLKISTASGDASLIRS